MAADPEPFAGKPTPHTSAASWWRRLWRLNTDAAVAYSAGSDHAGEAVFRRAASYAEAVADRMEVLEAEDREAGRCIHRGEG